MSLVQPILSPVLQGDALKELQANLGKLGLTIPASESGINLLGPGTAAAIKQFQASVNLPVTGTADAITLAMLTNAAAVGTDQSHLSGVLVMDYGQVGAGVAVKVYSIGYGGVATLLGETKTDANGVYSVAYKPQPAGANIEVRAVDAQGKETILSSVLYTAPARLALNLVAPAAVQPLPAEYQRISADVEKVIGGKGIQNLSGAKEVNTQRDLTLLSNTTGWDARLLAFAATAAQLTKSTGLGSDVLYALFRAGLPTDPGQLSLVSVPTVTAALQKAQTAGVVNFSEDQITASGKAFQAFADKTRLTLKVIGGVASVGDLLNASGIKDPAQSAAFASLVFSQPSPGDDFWEMAAALKIPAQELSTLQLQGKCYYLTLNNPALSQKIQQDIGAGGDLSQLAEKDYYDSATWKTALSGLTANGAAAAIPTGYTGSAAEMLEAYAGDLARKVRVSFPSQTVARMVETNTIPLGQSSAPVAAFLKAASAKGYQLGRTPLNAFLNASAKTLPVLSADDTTQLKNLHRLYQVTPSTESMQAALKLGFTSANDIAAYSRSEFMGQYAAEFPSRSEADLVYRKAQQISSVTFNFFSTAKQLDTNPPIYGLSSSPQAVQDAKNSIIEQFPSMQTLFGSMDFCQCDDCRSVLSPAAYFVDLMEFLRTSGDNAKGYTPLDALIGSTDGKIGSQAGAIPSRRADLAALPLTCENTNTAMPYIDIVNEVLEYYICHGVLDGGVAYDTGSVTTDDLTAEPQHILPLAYSQLMKANPGFGFPLGLPFDLWLETVRGFYSYFTISLVRVLEALRPIDQLELFPDANNEPYYRASIFAEMLGLSSSEYALFANTTPLQGWFGLYSYPNEAIALHGGIFPAAPPNFSYAPLTSAKCLAQYLGLTYVDVAQLFTTGFLNPALAAISFQFERFGIDMSVAFSYTSQPGSVALSAADTTAFEAVLAGITQQYKAQNPASTFDAKTWVKGILTANYSKKVLVLADQSSGCDFSTTTVMYADGSPAANLDFLKINLFVRLWQKTGWTMAETDRALQLFFAPGAAGLPAASDPAFGAAFSAAWKTALIYMAHLGDLASNWSPTLDKTALLPLWAPLPTTGDNPLYAQIFLTPGVLNIDASFDDPLGQFPGTPTDPLSAHQPGIQGALGLSATDVAAILADAGSTVDTVAAVVNGQPVQVPSFTLANLSLLYRYNLLATDLTLSIPDFIALKGIAVDLTGATPGTNGLNPFAPPTGTPLAVLKDDLLFTQTRQFIGEAAQVAGSGFTMEDLRYLLLHQYDPVGKYSTDEDAQLSLAQTLASGLLQIQTANAVPADLTGLSDDLIQQRLSGLFPATLLNGVVGLLTNMSAFTATQTGVAPGSQIDPTLFSDFPELSLSYAPISLTQTLTYKGVLLDWKKNQLEAINNSAFLANLLTSIQQQTEPAFDAMVGNLLGLWASLVRYEATRSVAAPVVFAHAPADPAFSTGYDAGNKVQWAVYRGVLTNSAMSTLQTASASADFAALLTDLQGQSAPAFSELLSFLLGLWAGMQTYQATKTAVPSASQIDPGLLSAYPQIQIGYDPGTLVQTLTFQGVLTTSLETALSTLIPAANPASAVLNGLLQSVRAQALAFYQAQAASWITVTLPATWDPLLDASAALYQGLDASKMLKTFKGELVKVFSPLLAQSLSAKLVTQTLSGNLTADPSLTGSLLNEIGILSDPGHPGKSLKGAFLSLGTPGISATFYASADQSGVPLGTGTVTASMASTRDASDPSPGITDSVHFEGYLQAPTDGAYRFYAGLANVGAKVVFTIDTPASASLVTNPVLSYTAVQAGDEVSQFVTLQGGIAYHFTLDFTKLGAGGVASLLVQGETLPKGPLSQFLLYPQATIDGFSAARILLSKSLQLITGTNLDETEVAYLSAHPEQFAGFTLGALPTQLVTTQAGWAAKARSLFAQFLMLADYADLRKGPAGGSDGLIAVFQGVGQVFKEALNSGASNQDRSAPWTILGNLTRRDPQVVRDVALQFGLLQQTIVGTNLQVSAVGDFANNKGIRRIWEALQVIQTIGLPVASVIKSTQIVSPARLTAVTDPGPGIAGDLRNAVRAQYGIDTWRPVAKSVFDPLRQKKRDALVAFVVRDLQLGTEEQLFEYFLVDPGMEPVVKTSRLRLALSSVQTFVQRCLLNLESGHDGTPELDISPSAIDADWWAWMKRYRVWEANREIFLYPENWMEPELRLDKTDLFQTLESALLKGDVTSDLVEDAFFKYLQGLDVRARLDIVATYLDQTGPPDATDTLYADYTLHVIGRTHGHPRQYFYRTYSNGAWTEWVQVTAPVDGDHVAVVVWRNRVNLFWVTFQIQSQAPDAPSDGGTKGVSLSSIDFPTLASGLQALAPQKMAQVQLNWSEYFQGTWSARLCSDVNQYDPIPVYNDFQSSQVYIHVTKEAPNAYGIEGPVGIHLDFPDPQGPPDTYSFWVTSKNGNPDFGAKYAQGAPINPYYTAWKPDSTEFDGAGTLGVWFTGVDPVSADPTTVYETILEKVNAYGLVLCANPVTPVFLSPTDPLYQEAGSLVSPFFYKDINRAGSASATRDESTFFVVPDVTEVTVEKWRGWVIGIPPVPIDVNNTPVWQNIGVISQVSSLHLVPPLGDPEPGDALYTVADRTDWLTNASTVVAYGSTQIGLSGGLNLHLSPSQPIL